MKKYLSLSSESISEEELKIVEMNFGFFPNDYRALLLHENGGIAHMSDGEDLLFYDISSGPNDIRKRWNDELMKMDSGFVPIAEFQNKKKLLIDLKTGQILHRGKIIAPSVVVYLETHCAPVEYENVLVNYIDNRMHGMLAEELDKNPLDPAYRLSNGFTLPQYAVIVSNEVALEILAKHGMSFSGTMHLLFKIGMINRPLIRALLDGGVDLNELNSDSLRVVDLSSPWVKHVIELSDE